MYFIYLFLYIYSLFICLFILYVNKQINKVPKNYRYFIYLFFTHRVYLFVCLYVLYLFICLFTIFYLFI